MNVSKKVWSATKFQCINVSEKVIEKQKVQKILSQNGMLVVANTEQDVYLKNASDKSQSLQNSSNS